MKRLAFLSVLLVFAFAAYGETYYVNAKTGDDANPGTQEKPLKTISASYAKLKPGDTVLAAGGTYHEELRPTVFGEKDKPITFKALDPKNPPILDGSALITHFKPHKEGIYVAEIDFAPSACFQDGKKMLPALWPSQTDEIDPYKTKLFLPIPAAGKKDKTDLVDPKHLKGKPADTFKGGYVRLYENTINSVVDKRITAYDPETGVLTVKPNRWQSIGKGDRYAVGGCMMALDAPGEWFLDRSASPMKIYLKPYDGKKPEDVIIRGTKLAHAINLRGLNAHHLIFDGFTIRGYHNPGKIWTQRALIFMSHGKIHHITIRNCTITQNHHGTGCEVRHVEDIVFENNLVYHNQMGAALGVGEGRRIKFINTHLHHNTGDGIFVGTGGKDKYVTFDVDVIGNRIHDHSSAVTHSDNLQIFKADGVRVIGNYFEKQGGQNTWFSKNGKIVFNNNIVVTGVAGLNSCTELDVINNVFYRSTIRLDAHQQHLAEERQTIKFINNAVVESSIALPKANNDRIDITFANNVFMITGRWPKHCWTQAFTARKQPVWGKGGKEFNAVEAFGFVDVKKRDFNLKADSPLRDAGAKTDAAVPDGKPDIGALEYGKEKSPPEK